MKKIFVTFAGLIIFLSVFTSCLPASEKFNVFKSITFGSDIESVENILNKYKIKYSKLWPAAGFEIDADNPEEIADALLNQGAGFLGEGLYKDSLYYVQLISGIQFESTIYFYKGVCTSIKLKAYVEESYSDYAEKGYPHAEKLKKYICQIYPDKSFVDAGLDSLGHNIYVMQVSDTVTITIRTDRFNLECYIEDSELQKPYKELIEKVNDLTHYYW